MANKSIIEVTQMQLEQIPSFLEYLKEKMLESLLHEINAVPDISAIDKTKFTGLCLN